MTKSAEQNTPSAEPRTLETRGFIGQIEQVVSSADCRSPEPNDPSHTKETQQNGTPGPITGPHRSGKSAEPCSVGCRECRQAYMREYHREWRGRSRDKIRTYWATFRYGLDPAEYQRLVDAHGSACGICGKRKRLAIDHDHNTGDVRGLLCYRCNRHLAAIEDTAWVNAANAYLGRHAVKSGAGPAGSTP